MGNANGVSLSIHLCRAIEFYKASENTVVWYSAFHWPSAGVQFQLLQLSPSRLWAVDITDWQTPCRLRRVALLLDLLLSQPSPSLD